jgi:uncharacterized RDD family membrane protein YckC
LKCPKCRYLGFDTGERCKNCGYDFSLVFDEGRPYADPDLPLRIEPEPPPPGPIWLDTFDQVEQAEREPAHVPPVTARSRDRGDRGTDLPLFDSEGADAALVTVPRSPRSPLAVRRTPVPAPRSRTQAASPTETAAPSRAEEPVLQFGADPSGEGRSNQSRWSESPGDEARPSRVRTTTEPVRDAIPRRIGRVEEPVHAIGPRALAGLIDYGILAGIDGVVLYFTLRMTELTVGEWRVLPLAPLLTFLLFVKVAYFSTFTAVGGQTIGKMATRLRVVTEDRRSVGLSRSLCRAAAGLASVFPLGAGLVPILLVADRRAFHDRVARTRVVSIRHA